MLAYYVACHPAYGSTGRCSNKRVSSYGCAKYRPADSANACPAQSRLLCSAHSGTPDKRKRKNKNYKNNCDAFHIISPF
jgi:hypothetical protein